MQNFRFLWGWVLFLVPFFVIYLSFFHVKFQFFARLGDIFEKKRKLFSCKTSVFAGLGAVLGSSFCHFFHFFMQNFSFLRGWVVFLGKKDIHFYANLQFLSSWMVFLVPFLLFFCPFI